MATDPTAEDLEQLLAGDPGGPVVMLDLLRFRPDGGRERRARRTGAARTGRLGNRASGRQ